MKKLLVLNGSHSDIPLIKAGKDLGYHVITTGNRPGLIGHQYADEYIYGDFSKPEEMYDLFRNVGLSGICSCANDFGAITAAYMADKMNLPGHDSYETTLLLHHKDKFKKFAKECGLPTPIADAYDSIQDAIANVDRYELPVMVKPVDLTGGKGVTKVMRKKEYETAVRKAFLVSLSSRIVIEPFIEGTQHSLSLFLINQKVAAYYSDNEYSYLNPFLVSTSAGPATDEEKGAPILISEAERIAKLLKLRDGIFHYQYILGKNGIPYILEITRRCSGDLYCVPVEHSMGIQWAEWIVRTELGMSVREFPKGVKQKGFGGRHCIMGEKNGVVKDVSISPEIQKNIYHELMWWQPGDRIENYMVDKLGILFLEYGSREEMIEKSERITDYVRIIYEM